MKLSELLTSEMAGPVLRPLFKAQNGRLTAIRLRKGEVIKEHESPVPAMLLVHLCSRPSVAAHRRPG